MKALYVAGKSSGVGKSQVCLGVLAALLQRGYSADQLGYFKPATQCTTPRPVNAFCEQHHILHVPSPVTFYAGFTHEFITKQSEPKLLHDKILDAFKQFADKKIVIVDGVGYPAVGSCVGISNATVANLLDAAVLLIGPEGVGDAIDSTLLNLDYFNVHHSTVIGAIFNNISSRPLALCQQHVSAFFKRHHPELALYGFIPTLEGDMNEWQAWAKHFSKYVDVDRIVKDL